MSRSKITNTSAAFAVAIAFLAGLIGSLALRPAGEQVAAGSGDSASTGEVVRRVHWRLPLSFQTTMPVLGDNPIYVTESLRAASGGAVDIRLFEPGEVVPAFGISEAVRDGKIEAGYTWLGYDQGRIPSSALLAAVPFGMEPWEYAAWWFEGEGSGLAAEIYHQRNVHPLLCSTIGPETAGWYRKPIKGLDDLQGLKIRFSGLGGMVLNEIGASATLMAGGEIFAALEKGTLDATEYSMPAIDEILGFHKIAKYNLFPGWHQPSTSTHLLINLDIWNELSAADQALFEMACTAATMRAITRGESLQGAQIQGFADKGVTAAKLPDDVIEELKRVSLEVINEEAAKDADFKRVWESQQAFHEQYQVWKEWGYLPRNFN